MNVPSKPIPTSSMKDIKIDDIATKTKKIFNFLSKILNDEKNIFFFVFI